MHLHWICTWTNRWQGMPICALPLHHWSSLHLCCKPFWYTLLSWPFGHLCNALLPECAASYDMLSVLRSPYWTCNTSKYILDRHKGCLSRTMYLITPQVEREQRVQGLQLVEFVCCILLLASRCQIQNHCCRQCSHAVGDGECKAAA